MQTTTMTKKNPRKNDQQPVKMAAADCCRLFSACFYPPDEKMLLKEGVIEKLGAVMKIACTEASPLVPPLPKNNGKELLIAYTKLFLGPPEVLAPPYASFYLDKAGGVMGPSAVAIEDLYKEAGLDIDEDFNEMPDHVAVVLEFLYYLLFRETVAANIGNLEEKQEMQNIREQFLQQYVFPWIPAFCEKIESADLHPFYTGLAKCLETFIHHEFAKKPESDGHGTV